MLIRAEDFLSVGMEQRPAGISVGVPQFGVKYPAKMSETLPVSPVAREGGVQKSGSHLSGAYEEISAILMTFRSTSAVS